MELTKGIGKHSGTVKSVEYFECKIPGRGIFIQINKVKRTVKKTPKRGARRSRASLAKQDFLRMINDSKNGSRSGLIFMTPFGVPPPAETDPITPAEPPKKRRLPGSLEECPEEKDTV